MTIVAGYNVSSNDLKSILLYLIVAKDADTWVSLCMYKIVYCCFHYCIYELFSGKIGGK